MVARQRLMRMRLDDMLRRSLECRGVSMTVMFDPLSLTLQLRVRVDGHVLDSSKYRVREL